MWECRCDCGRTVTLRGTRVAAGEQKSCGRCLPFREISVGDRFGKWTVVDKVVENDKPKLRVRCDCGRESSAYASSLLNGDSTMCSRCGWSHSFTNLPLAPTDVLSRYLIARAEKLGVKFSLSGEEIDLLKRMPCGYCGGLPSSKIKSKYRYQGLDRVIPDGPYQIDNVVPCCKLCNRAKSSMTPEQWKQWLERLVEFQCGMKQEKR